MQAIPINLEMMMAKNKRLEDRQAKLDDIVDVARQLFSERGYEATSMQQLASQAGIAANTIYWYFDDKDDVLTAVLNQLLADSWQQYQQENLSVLADKLLWLVDKFEQTQRLISTVHARIHHSISLATWHERFHQLAEGLLRHELQQHGISDERLEDSVKIFIFVIEGLLVHPLSLAQKQAICQTLCKSSLSL